MENLTLFITGFCIFSTYIFFLMRMIYRQHNIQKKSEPKDLDTEIKVGMEEKVSSN
jgi:hypothetical protein